MWKNVLIILLILFCCGQYLWYCKVVDDRDYLYKDNKWCEKKISELKKELRDYQATRWYG